MFFQAEDGIRDDLVTGVQTCALPIWPRQARRTLTPKPTKLSSARYGRRNAQGPPRHDRPRRPGGGASARLRSEERRVGKGVDLGGRRIIKKKKSTVRRASYSITQHIG